MPDEMFFSPDRRSLRRGQRQAARTQTCRPCFVWAKDDPDNKHRGVVMDVSPHGMRVRMIEILPTDTPIMIQMMRDDDFRSALSVPVEGSVMRYESGAGGFTDHGFEFRRKTIRTVEPKPLGFRRRRAAPAPRRTRMHTIDYTVGDRRGGRQGR